MDAPPPLEPHPPWWKERMIWLIIALPVSAVVAGIATVFIAAHDPDDLVKSEYVKSGMTVEAPREALDRAARLGLAATTAYRDGRLEVRLTPPGLAGDALSLTLVHPTQAEQDKKILLNAIGQGKYQAQVVLMGQGKRHVFLEPQDRSWRLEGDWHAPFSEETSLHAGAHHPSTHP